MSGMNFTEAQFEELQKNLRNSALGALAERGPNPPDISGLAPRPLSSGSRKSKPKPVVFGGPLDVTLVLHGHCPSKKSDYRTTETGRLILTPETKAEIQALTFQAMYQWGAPGVGARAPVDHPEVTTTFYVRSGRSDEDGKYLTLMDVLQHAGVIVNDNIAHFNGRKVHEPCVFVLSGDERVDIRVVKK